MRNSNNNNNKYRNKMEVKNNYKHLLIYLVLLIAIIGTHAITVAPTVNLTRYPPTTNATTKATNFPPFRLTSNNNITILHEVHEDQSEDHGKDEPMLVLNTHEILPQKTIKKKPYTLLDKILPTVAEYEKLKPIKEPIDLHPVTFDFNLGDLEDLEHVTIKKGDLSAEEVHLLREEPVDESLLDFGPNDGDDDDDASNMATENNESTATSDTTPAAVTIGPHILKIYKGKASKKGRELAKKDELQKSLATNSNSISRYFSTENNGDTNTTAEHLHAVNLFQIITNLFDHFYWQASEIRNRVTTGCGLEMQAYLTALHANYEWAQKAYDASGRYRGQILFGNDKWLGQKIFCYELNRELHPEQRKHFEFEFYVAVIALRLMLPQKIEVKLQLGECLPKSCTPQDVHAILTLDPHAQIINTINTQSESTINSSISNLQVHRVRTVPGIYNYWHELKFQIFISFMLTLVCIVVFGTWYQARLNQRQLSPIPAISAKIDANNPTNNAMSTSYNGKSFELYQMSTLDNNNVADVDANDVNGNRSFTSNNDRKILRDTNDDVASKIGTSIPIPTTTATSTTTTAGAMRNDNNMNMDKEAANYGLDTNSNGGTIGGTYEAKLQLGLHEQLLLCFAFQTNAASIFDIVDKKESQTSCVHGLRVFSVLWTILVHTYLQMFTIAENRYQRIIVERSIWYQFVGNATFSVDTFFFISGFLVTLLFMKQTKKYPEDTGQFVRRSFIDTIVFISYRYLRLTPAYLFVIFFNDFSLRQTSDSSVFLANVAPNTCSMYWWRNIFYINNFYPLSEICMIWSWYMANDMQFYIMASFLLVISTRYFKSAVLLISSFLLSSWAVSGIVSLHYHYTHKVAHPFESFDFLYDKPWQRVGTYIMGMLAGYIIYKVKTPPRFCRRINSTLLAGSFALLGLIIFGVWQGVLSELATAFYVSMGHTAFGLALIWIVLACCWDIAPTLNRVLSYRGLWPLSRLTYCTYLIHPVIMLITSYRMSGPVHLNNLFVFVIFLGNAVVSFGVAFFISILFEAPVIRILKILFRK